MVVSSTYSQHDCCSCGWCPHCGASINDWTSSKTCANCGEPVAWTLEEMRNYKIYRSDRRNSLKSPQKKAMDEKTVKAALSAEYDKAKPAAINALIKGERVEYMLLKSGLKVMRVRREEVKNNERK